MITISRKATRERGPVRTYGLFYAGPRGEHRYGGFQVRSGKLELPDNEFGSELRAAIREVCKAVDFQIYNDWISPTVAKEVAALWARGINRRRGGVGPRVYVGCLENRVLEPGKAGE